MTSQNNKVDTDSAEALDKGVGCGALVSPPFWPCPNDCINWCRECDPRKPMTNHHPRCEHVDASLMDVWRVTIPGEKGGCICGSEEEARKVAGDDEPMEITKERMHREVFENLPEFCGF